MNTIQKKLAELKASGLRYIYAPSEAEANNGIEWCIDNGYTTHTRTQAVDAIVNEFAAMNPRAYAMGCFPATYWIWSVEEELASA
jgi:hypothetical protein